MSAMKLCFHYILHVADSIRLYYYRKIHEQIFSPIPHKEYKEHLVYTNQNYEEEFQWPSKPYILNISEIKKIKNHLSVINDVALRMKLSVCIIFILS